LHGNQSGAISKDQLISILASEGAIPRRPREGVAIRAPNPIRYPAEDGRGADAVAHSADLLALEDSDLCTNLTAEEVALLRDASQRRVYRQGEAVVQQGHAVDAVYLPCSGTVMVERSGSGGQRQVLAFLQRGYFLGFNTSDRFLYSAIALEESQLYRFSAQDFNQLRSDIPALRDNVGRITNQVLARVLDHLFAVGQKRAHARLAFLLWQLWYRASNDGSKTLLRLPMRRVDIGDYLGLTLETTSRAFSRLRQDGVIATPDNSSVQILDIATLQALADVK
jgi:CRP-like cAMP-binding protein